MMNPLSLFAMFAWLLLMPAGGGTESVASLLEKGIYNEETVGNLDEAIRIYKQIVEDNKANRVLVARAMYRLGTCQLKRGRTDDGIATFETLTVQYPEQKDLVEQARKKIVAARRSTSEAQAARKVKEAVMSISTRTEGDPEVAKALKSLADLDSAHVVEALVPYLDSDQATVRRSAIYILWRGELDDIKPAVKPLLKACSHPEDLTRGMATLALGGNKVDESFPVLAEMALNDKSGYARRCAAYALGLLGRADAKGVLEKAKKDKDPLVRNNAEAALRMLEQSQRRTVGKPVSAFEDKVDLSTPESACAAYLRASARMDAKAVVDLSWVKIDPKEMETFWKLAGQDDLEAYNNAQRDAIIEEVLYVGDDLAQVTALLKFPEGKGRHPYSARIFGRINGQWKNLGEDRCPSLKAARDNFEQKKDRLREHFEEIKKEMGPREAEGPRQVAKQFLAAAAAGKESEAVRLTSPGSAVAHQVKEFQKIPDINKARIESAYADEKAAVAVTSNVIGDHKRKGPLFISLIRERGLWVINDVDLVDLEKSPNAAKERLDRFLKMHPDAKPIAAGAVPEVRGTKTGRGGRTTFPSECLKLVDPETRDSVNGFEKSFASFFRPESAYQAASPAEQGAIVEKWMAEAEGKDFDKRTRAIAALGNVAAQQALHVLLEIVDEPMGNQRPKWMAVRGLGRIGDPVAVPALIELVDYGNTNVRVYARATLAEITGVYFGTDKEKWRAWWKERGKNVSAAEKREAEQIGVRAWQVWGKGQFAEAEKLFKQAVAKDPTNAHAYNGLGWSQFNQGRPLAAKLAFEECLKLDPDVAGALNGLGWIAKGEGKTDEAMTWWRKALRADPKATAAMNGLAMTSMEQKRYDEAEKMYEQWLRLDPSSEDAKAGLEKAKAAAK